MQNKNNAVIAFVALTVVINLVGAWRAIEGTSSDATSSRAPLAPLIGANVLGHGLCHEVLVAGPSMWIAATSFVTTLISWTIYASIAMDDQGFYGSTLQYPCVNSNRNG